MMTVYQNSIHLFETIQVHIIETYYNGNRINKQYTKIFFCEKSKIKQRSEEKEQQKNNEKNVGIVGTLGLRYLIQNKNKLQQNMQKGTELKGKEIELQINRFKKIALIGI